MKIARDYSDYRASSEPYTPNKLGAIKAEVVFFTKISGIHKVQVTTIYLTNLKVIFELIMY